MQLCVFVGEEAGFGLVLGGLGVQVGMLSFDELSHDPNSFGLGRCGSAIGHQVGGVAEQTDRQRTPGVLRLVGERDRVVQAGARAGDGQRGETAGDQQVAQVLHPAVEGSPGHEHWRALCGAANAGQGAAAGLFSVMIDARYSQAQVDAFCDGLRLFKLGYSWGGPMSLVVPYQLASMRSRPAPHLQPGTLVRFSVGLEEVEDLRQDLEQAMRGAFGAA